MKSISDKRLQQYYKDKCRQHYGACFDDYPVELLYYEKGELLCYCEEQMDYLLIFVSGRTKTYHLLENGRRLLFHFSGDVEILGDLELVGDTDTSMFVEAITPAYCLGIPLAQQRKRLLEDSEVLRVIGKELALKLHRSSKHTASGMIYPLEKKLAAYMLNTEEEGIFKEHLGDVSEVMGSSYRHLLRILKQYCVEGIAVKEKSGYRITDYKKLRRLGEDVYHYRR